jgi:polysaccharide export outer membrane protein
MTSRTFFSGALFSILLGVSCAPGFCADPDRPASAPAQAAAPQAGDGNASRLDSDRKLSPNDVISVTVYQEDELATKTIIDKNGMVMLPLLHQVKVSNMTVGEARAKIQQLYDKDYLVDPQVNVLVETFAQRRYSVMGQVEHPGTFDFPQNESVNLLQAISMAGGYKRLGNASKVDVRRIENGAPHIYHLDAAEMAKDSKNKTFEILPDDVITVGERTF